MNHWYSKSVSEVLKLLESGQRGLSNQEADLRLKECGYNALPGAKADGFFTIFLRQFQSPLIYILLLASLIVFIIGEPVRRLNYFGCAFF